MQKEKWFRAILSAAADYRLVSAAEGAEQVAENMKTLKQRTTAMQQTVATRKESAAQALSKHDRYASHVARLEEEVKAAKSHAEAASLELMQARKEAVKAEQALASLQLVRTLDDGLSKAVNATLRDCEEPLALLYEAYAGSMYQHEEEEEEEEGEGGGGEGKSSATSMDRAELMHLLQDFEILGRGSPPDILCGVFLGFGQVLSFAEFERCVARAALGLVPDDADHQGDKLGYMLTLIPERIEHTRLISLDVRRRFKVLTAADMLAEILTEEE